jgi:raffinose/stachyose/melibiose transport system substrate-binding protein
MKKRLISGILGFSIVASLLIGCSSKPTIQDTPSTDTDSQQENNTPTEVTEAPVQSDKKYEGIVLNFMSNTAGVQSTEMEKVIVQFEAETGAKVEYSTPGASFEELLKTRMATNQLPDLWTTHGWSIARYGEYLEPLNNQSWASELSDSAKQIIINPKTQNFYCLPVDVDVAGMVYNKTVLENAGVTIDELKTWDSFAAACDKIKAAGYIPIHIGGKDSWTIGQYFDYVAPSLYITDETKNYRTQFKDGTFDWSLWADICYMLKDWKDKEFFNVDALTSDYNSAIKAMAEDKVAFEFYGNYAINEMLNVNPNANVGMMPVPSNSETDSPTLIGGERIAIGVWKDSPNKEAALELLSYFAKHENMIAIASSDGAPASFNGVESDTGILKDDLEKYMDECRVFTYFDREYLPSGMWDDMCVTGASILAGETKAVENAIDIMKNSFEAKLDQ